jgi:hypothetical protein
VIGLVSTQLDTCVARSVKHANDDDFGFRVSVVNGIVAVKMNPEAGRQILPSRTEFGMMAKRLETIPKPVDEGCRRRRIVGSDERPNVGEVVFGLFG